MNFLFKSEDKKEENQKQEKVEIQQNQATLPNTKNYNILFLILSTLNFITVIFEICFILIFYFFPNSFHGHNINE